MTDTIFDNGEGTCWKCGRPLNATGVCECGFSKTRLHLTRENVGNDYLNLKKFVDAAKELTWVTFTMEGFGTLFGILKNPDKSYDIRGSDSIIRIKTDEYLNEVITDAVIIGIEPYHFVVPYTMQYIIKCHDCGTMWQSDSTPKDLPGCVNCGESNMAWFRTINFRDKSGIDESDPERILTMEASNHCSKMGINTVSEKIPPGGRPVIFKEDEDVVVKKKKFKYLMAYELKGSGDLGLKIYCRDKKLTEADAVADLEEYLNEKCHVLEKFTFIEVNDSEREFWKLLMDKLVIKERY